jgi:5-methylcytosine-specific restriction enzyme B
MIPPNLYLIGTMNLIDQSVEQIDFAMRRRFLWQESRFAKDALLAILEERWRAEQRTKVWDKVAPDMELLAESAERLNQKIASVEELGENYEIGHTYILDIVELLDAKLSSRSSTYLWTRSGAPKEALEDLWSLALEPLLREYLAGLDAVRRAQLLEELWTTFKARS